MHRRLPLRTSLTVQYAYAASSGNLISISSNAIGPRFNFKQHAIRMSLTWGGLGGSNTPDGSAASSAGNPTQ